MIGRLTEYNMGRERTTTHHGGMQHQSKCGILMEGIEQSDAKFHKIFLANL